jgi:hypothetical protein
VIRSARKKAIPLDDAASQAGWVFADLLLLLSIIFLTSISFALPSSSENGSEGVSGLGGNSVAPSIDQTITNNPYEQGYYFVYSSFDKDRLLKDLSRYFASKAMPTNTDVIYAQLVGGYKEGTEGSDAGTMAALKFSIELTKAKITAFENTSVDLLTSSKIPSGYVALRLTFAPAVGN